jgi:hypothetical protein
LRLKAVLQLLRTSVVMGIYIELGSSIKERILKTSAKESLGLHELKQYKPWPDEECVGTLDQRKQAKIEWIQD